MSTKTIKEMAFQNLLDDRSYAATKTVVIWNSKKCPWQHLCIRYGIRRSDKKQGFPFVWNMSNNCNRDKRVIEHFAKEKKEGNIKIKRNKLGELANCFHSACWRSAIYEIATNDPFTDEIVINQKWISRLINEGDEKMFQKVGEYVDLSNYKIEK